MTALPANAGLIHLSPSSQGSDKTNAVIAGVFFIAATVTAIVGLLLYNPLLASPDYLSNGAAHANEIVLGAVFELMLVVTATGTGIMFFPYLRKFNERLGLGYLFFRFLEAIMILVGIVSVLALLTLSQSYNSLAAPDIAAYETAGITLKAIHDWTFILGPNFLLGINTFTYSYVFFRTGFVPKPLAVLGLTGAVAIFTAGLLEMFGIVAQFTPAAGLLALPVATYEMVLAVWLIVKGFNLEYLSKQSTDSLRQQPFAVSM